MTPQLRFPEFTDQWKAGKFGDLCDMKAGKFISAKDIQQTASKDLYPCYGGNGLRGFVDHYSHSGNYSLVGRQGALCGNVNYVSGDFYATEHALVVYPQSDIDSKWLYYQLKRFNLNRFATGQAQPGLSVDTVLSIKQSNPPQKREQKKIADFLTAVDERIAANERKCELLAHYKRGVMQQLFSQKIHFKKSDGTNYPDWQEKKIGDVFDEVTNKVGSRNIETYSITAGKGFVSQAKKFGRDISGLQNERYILLSENEFAYNKGNSKTYTYGCVYENKEDKQIAVPNVFISFKLKDEGMASGFFAQLFVNHYLDRHLRKIISSGARMDGLLNVNKADFFSISIPVPTIEEQQKIANFLTTLDDRITIERTKLTAVKQFKKALLQRMFV